MLKLLLELLILVSKELTLALKRFDLAACYLPCVVCLRELLLGKFECFLEIHVGLTTLFTLQFKHIYLLVAGLNMIQVLLLHLLVLLSARLQF